MSVSLLSGGRLWGLIACHGRSAKALSPPVRSACEFFGVALSLQIAALREHDAAAARDRSRAVIARLLPAEPLSPAVLAEIADCDAVVVRTAGVVEVHGESLDRAIVDELLAALPVLGVGELWQATGSIRTCRCWPGTRRRCPVRWCCRPAATGTWWFGCAVSVRSRGAGRPTPAGPSRSAPTAAA